MQDRRSIPQRDRPRNPSRLATGLLTLFLTASLALAGDPPPLQLDGPLAVSPSRLGDRQVDLSGQTWPGVIVGLRLPDWPGEQVVAADGEGRFSFGTLMLPAGDSELVLTARRREAYRRLVIPVTVKLTPPPLALRSPAAAGERVTVPWTDLVVVAETEPGCEVRVGLAGSEILPQVAGRDGVVEFRLPGVMADGDNLVAVEAVDPFGRVTTALTTVQVRRDAPRLLLAEPLTGDLTTTLATLPVEGWAEPGATLRFGLGDAVSGELRAAADGRFLLAGLPWAEGVNDLWVETADVAANRGRVARRVTIDSTPPALQLDEPLSQAGLVTAASWWDLAGRAEPGALLTLRHNGQAVASIRVDETGRFAFRDLPLVAGGNSFEVTASDALGNRAVVRTGLTVDREPPVVTVVEPELTRDLETPQTSLLLRTEPGARLAWRRGDQSDEQEAPASGLVRFVGLPLDDGANAFVLTATDRLRNTGVTRLVIQARVSPPRLAVSVPAPGALVGNSPAILVEHEADLSLTASLNGQILTAVATSPVAGAWSLPLATTRFEPADLPAGPQRLEVELVSLSGLRRQSASSEFHVCGGPAAVQLELLGEARPGAELLLTATVTDQWGRPVADGTPVTVVLPAGWQQAGESRLAEVARGGRVAVRLTAPARPGAYRLLAVAGTVGECVTVSVAWPGRRR